MAFFEQLAGGLQDYGTLIDALKAEETAKQQAEAASGGAQYGSPEWVQAAEQYMAQHPAPQRSFMNKLVNTIGAGVAGGLHKTWQETPAPVDPLAKFRQELALEIARGGKELGVEKYRQQKEGERQTKGFAFDVLYKYPHELEVKGISTQAELDTAKANLEQAAVARDRATTERGRADAQNAVDRIKAKIQEAEYRGMAAAGEPGYAPEVGGTPAAPTPEGMTRLGPGGGTVPFDVPAMEEVPEAPGTYRFRPGYGPGAEKPRPPLTGPIPPPEAPTVAGALTKEVEGKAPRYEKRWVKSVRGGEIGRQEEYFKTLEGEAEEAAARTKAQEAAQPLTGESANALGTFEAAGKSLKTLMDTATAHPQWFGPGKGPFITGAKEYFGGSQLVDPAITKFDSDVDFTRKQIVQAMSGLGVPVKEAEDYVRRIPTRGDVADPKTFNAKLQSGHDFVTRIIDSRLKYLTTGKGALQPTTQQPQTAEEYLRMRRGQQF